jgi:hypothetical protein
MKKLQLDKSEMYKCEVCGGFHKAEETEVVTIKIIKGKACDLKGNPIQQTVTPMVLPKSNDLPDVRSNQQPTEKVDPMNLPGRDYAIINGEKTLLGDKTKRPVVPDGFRRQFGNLTQAPPEQSI